jgi:uncharacterized membrane protein
MRVLVTGANGFLAAQVAAALREAGHEVVAGLRLPRASDLEQGEAIRCDFARDVQMGRGSHASRASTRSSIALESCAARITVRADWIFTTPALIVQPLSGAGLMWLAGYPLTTPWLFLAILLYLLAGACWLPVVALQLRMRNLSAEAARSGSPLPAAYYRSARWWFALGWPAFIAVLAIFWLMIAKPQLW